MSGDHENCDKIENPLKNWSTWTQEWRKVQANIARKLHREPGNLLVNYSEGLRSINEEKQALDSAKIPTEFDKYRGKPDFWHLPFALPRKHPCCPSEPDYFAVKTKQEGYEIPPIEHKGVPTVIRNEKNILNGTRNIYKRWQNSQYRYEQFIKWAEKVAHIVPHWPDLQHLVVIGSKIANEESGDHADVASETTKVSEVGIEETVMGVANETKRLDLKINGLDVGQEHDTRKIWLNFEFDISGDEAVSQFLIFDNCGLATLRVSFEKLEKFRLFREEPRESFRFYFDRKQVVILPGMRAEIPIWFKTDRPGTYSENWEIRTQPALWSDDFRVILVLNAYSCFKNLQQKIDTTVKLIEIKARNLLIKNLLDDCLKTIQYKETPPKVCAYGEKELFELANFSMGRPQFIYDEKLVKELNQIYDRVKSGEEKWDFSISSLTKLAHRKDTIIYLDNKMLELVEHILKIEKEAQEPPKKIETKVKEKKQKKKKDKKSDKKTKSSKSSTSQPVQETKPVVKPEPFEYSNQAQVWDVVRKFDSPVIINTQREKYLTCHSVLSAYFGKMCHSLNELELEIGLNSTRTYPRVKNRLLPTNELPERLVYEYFEHHYIPTVPLREVYPYDAKKKPKILRHVASDDAEALYTIYFNKTIGEVDKKKKGKGGKEKKKGKGDKEKKKGKGDKEKKKKDKGDKHKKDKGKKKKKVESRENIKKEISVESFNPYKEQFVYFSESEDEVVDNAGVKKWELSKEELNDYKYKQYLIVYSSLGNAVDALVDTLESFKCVVSYPTLSEVKSQDEKH